MYSFERCTAKFSGFKVSSGLKSWIQLSLFGIVTRLEAGQSRKFGPVLSIGRDISVLIRITGTVWGPPSLLFNVYGGRLPRE